jgi:hypothetical protein
MQLMVYPTNPSDHGADLCCNGLYRMPLTLWSFWFSVDWHVFFLFNLFGSSQIVGLAPVISRKPYLRTSQNHLHLTSGQTPTNDARWWACEYKECKDQNGLQGSREINHLSSL